MFSALTRLIAGPSKSDKRLAKWGLGLLVMFVVGVLVMGSMCSTNPKIDANQIVSPWDTSSAPKQPVVPVTAPAADRQASLGNRTF